MSRHEQMPPAKEELHAGEAIPHPENEAALPVLAKDQIVNDQQTLLYNQFKYDSLLLTQYISVSTFSFLLSFISLF